MLDKPKVHIIVAVPFPRCPSPFPFGLGPDSRTPNLRTPNPLPPAVFFHHLRSYEHMGVALFSCVSGCACAPTEVDGHHAEKVSQLYMVVLEVSQATACDIEIKVGGRD